MMPMNLRHCRSGAISGNMIDPAPEAGHKAVGEKAIARRQGVGLTEREKMIGKIKRTSWRNTAVLQATATAGAEVSEKLASALASKTITEPSWDPHDVWLKRVRQPRLERDAAAAEPRRPRAR
jgi:hypothetical protein